MNETDRPALTFVLWSIGVPVNWGTADWFQLLFVEQSQRYALLFCSLRRLYPNTCVHVWTSGWWSVLRIEFRFHLFTTDDCGCCVVRCCCCRLPWATRVRCAVHALLADLLLLLGVRIYCLLLLLNFRGMYVSFDRNQCTSTENDISIFECCAV